MDNKLAVLIPALNEEKNIREVIQGVKKAITAEVVVIDDASSDSTATVARQEGAMTSVPNIPPAFSVSRCAWKKPPSS